ncbi:MAG TPA: cupin domain-containing protein [Myxococcales bacterium]|nr:cupin domain-containing protein [Myxococcales bacterium]
MRTMFSVATVSTAMLCFGAFAHDEKAAKPEAVYLNSADLKWGDAPPVFPKGAKVAILHGNPFAKGVFALRFKLPDAYKVPPHWHTQAEQLTVVSGTFILHLGDTMDAPAHALEAGAYHYLPGKMHHAAETKGEVVLEVHGQGPFDMHYLNPADDPTKAAAAK